jgi:hypothetical protein
MTLAGTAGRERSDNDRCDDDGQPRPSTAGARSVAEAQRTPDALPFPALRSVS